MTDATTVSARELLSRLDKVRKSGDGWVALCPAHEDKEPSLSVSEGRDGRVLLNCHRGCSFDQITDALDVAAAALMGDASDAPAGKGNPAPPLRTSPKPKPADYDYEDAEGNVVFRVTRYYQKKGDGTWGKRFVQKRPDGAGGWTNGRGDTPSLPYNLPAVLAAVSAGEPVYVVEGEKDVATLQKWGRVGTCNAGGAGKWEQAFGALLQDADVVVLPDNDEPGRAHAADVVRSVQPYAASVVAVDLPGLPPKGDLSDWAASGHDCAEMEALVARVRAARDAGTYADDAVDLGPVRRPLVNLSDVDPAAFRALPKLLRELCEHYPTGPDKNVALFSGLAVLSACMQKARVAHYDQDYGLQLMFCLVAGSGAGKGVLDQVARLTYGVHGAVKDDHAYRLQTWEAEAATLKGPDKAAIGPRPFSAMCLIPANASKSFALKAIDASGETALIVETEIDTLVSASEQEWGDISDVIRKAFHHEGYRMGRMGGGGAGETLEMERPSLALALSGTWDQFDRLFAGNVSNGFFNRFAFYVSNQRGKWRSPRPTRRSVERNAWLSNASDEVLGLYSVLGQNAGPFIVHIPASGWDRIDAAYEPAYEAAASSDMADRALPFVQRGALMCARLVGILTVLRAHEHGSSLVGPGLTATDFDVALAVHIASIWHDHGSALLTHLSPPAGSPLVGLTDEARALLDELPERFKRADANELGEAEGVSPRTVKRYLQQYQKAGLIRRDGHTYHKADLPDESRPFQPNQ